MKNLLLICGGQSPEHAISLRSVRNILKALDESKYNVTLLGITMEGRWRLIETHEIEDVVEVNSQGKPVSLHPGEKDILKSDGETLGPIDVIFPVLHGPNGEDGTVQGLFRLLGIPFVGPGVLGSAVSMDKDVTKRLLRYDGISVVDWILIRRGDKIPSYDEVKTELGGVVFVKPANMGSSVGVHRVSGVNEWLEAVQDALKYDSKVLVEKLIEGRELECAVMGNETPKASGVGEVRSGNFYSYDEKYDSSSEAQIDIPANIDSQYLPALKDTAEKAYKALDCEGMSRVDMFLTEQGEVFVNEVNTIPGFTSISMYPKLWEEAGLSYKDLLDQLIDLAIERG